MNAFLGTVLGSALFASSTTINVDGTPEPMSWQLLNASSVALSIPDPCPDFDKARCPNPIGDDLPELLQRQFQTQAAGGVEGLN
jgi:hypothetical protein